MSQSDNFVLCYNNTFKELSEEEYNMLVESVSKKVEDKGYILIQKDGGDLKNNIIKLLDERGINPADLSKKTGLLKQSISNVILGNTEPNVSFALKVSKVLGVKVEDVFELSESSWYSIAKNPKGQSLFFDNETNEIVTSDMIDSNSVNRYYKLGNKIVLLD